MIHIIDILSTGNHKRAAYPMKGLYGAKVPLWQRRGMVASEANKFLVPPFREQRVHSMIQGLRLMFRLIGHQGMGLDYQRNLVDSCHPKPAFLANHLLCQVHLLPSQVEVAN
jgi:hypothetical protein